MTQARRVKLSGAQRADMWGRWKAGEGCDSPSMRKPNPSRRLLLYAGLAVIADTVREDSRQPGFLGSGKCLLVIAEGDGLELAFEDIVARRPAGHRPWPREGRIHLVALSAAKCLRFDDAFPGRRSARVHEIRWFRAQTPGQNGIARRVPLQIGQPLVHFR